MADISPCPTPPDAARSRFSLPHWGWFLLATIVTMVGFVGMSFWLLYHQEQQVIQMIENWGGSAGLRDTCPEWLGELLDNKRLNQIEIFNRVDGVDLSDTAVTDADLAHLNRLSKLQFLYLGGTTVTDAGLSHLSGLRDLRVLTLDGSPVTNAFLAYLHGSKNLEELRISDTSVTDAGLVHLSGCTNLKSLVLTGTAVTGKGVEELETALPKCDIFH